MDGSWKSANFLASPSHVIGIQNAVLVFPFRIRKTHKFIYRSTQQIPLQKLFKLLTLCTKDKASPGPNPWLGRPEGPILFRGSNKTRSLPCIPVLWLPIWSFSKHTPFCCRLFSDRFSCHALTTKDCRHITKNVNQFLYHMNFVRGRTVIHSTDCLDYLVSSISASLSSCKSSSVLETKLSTSISVTNTQTTW